MDKLKKDGRKNISRLRSGRKKEKGRRKTYLLRRKEWRMENF